VTDFDLAVLGSGSGAGVVDAGFHDWRVAIVDDLRIGYGGTCLNAGCIPSKMFGHTADLADVPATAGAFGLTEELRAVDWPRIRDRVFGRTDALSAAGLNARRTRHANITLIEGTARFTGPRTLEVDGRAITADRFVVATGSRPGIPDVPGLADSGFVTSETIMRLDRLPDRMAILGGGVVAAEFAHVFGSLGVEITVVARASTLLRSQDDDVSALFTDIAARAWDVRLNRTVTRVERSDGIVRLRLADSQGIETGETVEADCLLVAVGRIPNSDRIGADAAGIDVRPDGRITVDDHQHTTAPGIWALGDVCSPFQLKHVANHEARVVRHNVRHPSEPIAADHRFVPQAVFTSPHIASVGRTERAARAEGIEFTVGRRDYPDIAYGWAMNDPDGFAKVLADPRTGRLLGAHIIGPQAATLIQPLVQAISFGQDARELARGQYWIHPAMPELVENALLDLRFPEG
jgi:mycothione reductase